MSIKISYRRIEDNELLFTQPTQTPITKLKEFWNDSDEEYEKWLIKHEIQWKYEQNAEYIKNHIEKIINKIAIKLKQDFASFDIKLYDSFEYINRSNISTTYFQQIDFSLKDTENTLKEVFKNIIKTIPTRSFFDIRDIQEDHCIIQYMRIGMNYEYDKYRCKTSKEVLSIKESSRGQDINYIMAGIIFECAEKLPEDTLFFFENPNSKDHNIEIKVKEIIDSHRIIAEKLYAQKMRKPQSQKPESLIQHIEQCREDFVIFDSNNLIEEYKKYRYSQIKEDMHFIQKYKEEAYSFLKECLINNIPIKQALNMCKQKFREDCIVDIASLMLSQDVIQSLRKDEEIHNLIEKANDEQKKYIKEIEKINNEKLRIEEQLEHTLLEKDKLEKDMLEITNMVEEAKKEWEQQEKEHEEQETRFLQYKTEIEKFKTTLKEEFDILKQEYKLIQKELELKNEYITDIKKTLALKEQNT